MKPITLTIGDTYATLGVPGNKRFRPKTGMRRLSRWLWDGPQAPAWKPMGTTRARLEAKVREPIHPAMAAAAVGRAMGVTMYCALVIDDGNILPTRKRRYVEARWVLVHVLRRMLPTWGMPDVARWVAEFANQGKRAHTTWGNAWQSCSRRPDLLRIADEVVQELRR